MTIDRTFQPTLILYIQADGGFAIDATLSPDTRRVLTKVSAEHQKGIPFLELPESQLTEVVSEPKSSEYHADPSTEEGIRRGTIKKVEVPLTFDAEFFGLLQQDVSSLEELQAEEQRNLTDEIEVVGKEIAALAMPGLKAKKSDLDVWREIFDIYLQAGIFFSTHEIGGGSRDSTAAAKQLNWFQDQVTKRELLSLIKKPASRLALDRFIAINIKLLRNLSFQEINQTAIRKILKSRCFHLPCSMMSNAKQLQEFDKRTSLNAKTTFPKLIQSEPFMSATMAKAVCASVSTQIVTTIPQLDDWSCQVCSDIAYKPIKLACQHMFCIRCMIQLQQRKERRCPMCRKATVLSADSSKYLQVFWSFQPRV